jgi:hypothetical protein
MISHVISFQSEPFMKFTTYLVTHRNDGTPVAESEKESILQQAWQRFGGYTLSSPQVGAWVDDAGTLYSDWSERMEIVCDRERLFEAIEWVKEIGRGLGQKAMYFEVRDYDGVQILEV